MRGSVPSPGLARLFQLLVAPAFSGIRATSFRKET
jgi:hypothetical protein